MLEEQLTWLIEIKLNFYAYFINQTWELIDIINEQYPFWFFVSSVQFLGIFSDTFKSKFDFRMAINCIWILT